MKKNYIAPSTQVYVMHMEPLMGINSISDDRAGAGSSDSPVNFSREGGSWDDED